MFETQVEVRALQIADVIKGTGEVVALVERGARKVEVYLYKDDKPHRKAVWDAYTKIWIKRDVHIK